MWNSFVNFFLDILLYIYKLCGNFGVAIILFTLLIKLILYPLMVSQIKSSNAMMAMQTSPEYLEMMEKYKNDKDKLAEEQMKLYKKMGVNPTASCLPLMLQLPIIFALYQAIIVAIVTTPMGLLDLTKRVNTNVIKLWEIFPINPNFLWMNLGLPERLHISGLSFGIPVLTILVVVTTWLQSKLTQTTSQPQTNANGQPDQTAMMNGMMNIYMPVLMGFMAYTLASGLSLYFLISNVFTIVQYAMLGGLHWENLKPGKKQPVKPVKSAAKKYSKPYTAPQSAAEAAPAAKQDSAKEDSKVISAPAEDFSKIDYNEFKNHKKPKKKSLQS